MIAEFINVGTEFQQSPAESVLDHAIYNVVKGTPKNWKGV